MVTPGYDTLEDLMQIDMAELEWVKELISDEEYEKIFQELMEDDPSELVLPDLIHQAPPAPPPPRQEVRMDMQHNAWNWPPDMVKDVEHYLQHGEVFSAFREIHQHGAQQGGYAAQCQIAAPQHPPKYLQQHPGNVVQLKKVKNFQCNLCGKCYANQRSLHNHSFVHTGKFPYTCEFCHRSFRYHTKLKEHQRTLPYCGHGRGLAVRDMVEE